MSKVVNNNLYFDIIYTIETLKKKQICIKIDTNWPIQICTEKNK